MEKQTGFTPGPWTIHADGETVFAKARRVANCTTKATGLYQDERQANARLIAAAPELLDAVRGLIGLVQLVEGRADISASELRGSHRYYDAMKLLERLGFEPGEVREP